MHILVPFIVGVVCASAAWYWRGKIEAKAKAELLALKTDAQAEISKL